MEFGLKDSGDRRAFATGAVRDMAGGKGRYDLISPYMKRRLAVHMEKGAGKYGDRNWEKGMPFSVFMDSAQRHIDKFVMGWTDEDHIAAAIFNLQAIAHFQELGRDDLDDMPHYEDGPRE